MLTSIRLSVIGLSLFACHRICVAAAPSELIVGQWRDRAVPDDAVIKFSKDGSGTITETTPAKTSQALISWKIGKEYDNACVVNIKYEKSKRKGAKPLPKEAAPFKWLVVFDGEDRFVFQGRPNEVTVMDRLSSDDEPEAKQAAE
jgi:hypothetical protein